MKWKFYHHGVENTKHKIILYIFFLVNSQNVIPTNTSLYIKQVLSSYTLQYILLFEIYFIHYNRLPPPSLNK